MANGPFGAPIRHSLLTIRFLSLCATFLNEKNNMAHFDILENKNHQIFKLWQHRQSALAAKEPEAARVKDG
jgi:hypothetical protein